MKISIQKVITVVLCLGLSGSWAALADDSEQPPNFDLWAALSFSMDRAKSGIDPMGRAFHENSEYVAKDMAIRACADSDCEIKVSVNAGCIAVATGSDAQGLNWWGFGESPYARKRDERVSEGEARARKEAGEAARDACLSATHGQECSVSESFCTWDGGPAATSQAVEDWVAQMGGEQSHDVADVVQLVNVTTQGFLLNLGLDYEKSSCLHGQRWARAVQMAQACSLSVDDLDRLDAEVNRYR